MTTKSVSANNDAEKGTTHAAFANYFKQLFGAGILSLPHAFGWSGLYPGIAIYFCVCGLCIYSMLILIQCKQFLRDQGVEHIDTYPSLARHVFASQYVYWAVSAIVVVLELAFCTGWVIVAADNLVVVCDQPGITRSLMALLLFPIVGALSCIKFLKDLWVLSVFGFFVYLLGVMGVTYLDIAVSSDPPQYENYRLNALPMFVGNAFYGIEAILMVMSIEGSMREPKQAKAVIFSATVIYAVLACLFGVIAYMYGYGTCTEDDGATITDCMPDSPRTTIVRVMLAVSLILGYPCLLFPVSEIIDEFMRECSTVRRTQSHKPNPKWPLLRATQDVPAYTTAKSSVAPTTDPTTLPDTAPATEQGAAALWQGELRRVCVRLLTALITCVVAAVCTNFAKFSSVVGGVLVPTAGLLLPALIHLRISSQYTGFASPSSQAADYGFLVCFVVLFGLGIYILADPKD